MDNRKQVNPPNKSSNKNTILVVVIIAISAALIAGLAVWAWQSQKNEDAEKENDSRIKDLEDQADASKDKDSKNESGNEKADSQSDKESKPSASQKTISAILTASKTKDYSGLKPMFADKMHLAMARSYGGYDTPDNQVVNILNTASEKAIQPWNFDIDAEDVQKKESYNEYVSEDMYIGVSSDKKGNRYVTSFKIDNDGKIRSIFLGNEKTMTS